MKSATYLTFVFMLALMLGGCAAIKKPKKNDQPQIVGTRAEADIEEAAYVKEGGKKGQVRIRCTNRPKTGSRIRKKRCWFYGAAEEERRETTDQIIRNTTRGAKYNGR